MKHTIASFLFTALIAVGVTGCGGGGNAVITRSPDDLARGATRKGCEARSSSDVSGGQYIVCDDEVYIAAPMDNGGAFVGCEKAGDEECGEKARALAGG